jgi:outer membrane protein
MKKTWAMILCTTTFSMADFIGGELNVGYYTHAPRGTVEYQGTPIDIEDDLKWKDKGDIFLKAYVEHPLPILPNLKVGYTEFGHSGAGVITQSFQFASQTYTVNSNIDSTFNLKMYDLTLYYELLDNWVNVDTGVNVKYIDGLIRVNNSMGLSESKAFQVPVPMLYAKARFDLPTTNLTLQAEGNYVAYKGNQFYDAEVGARYTLALGVGIEAGYKLMKLKLDDIDDLSMETDFSGVYGKLVWDF